MHLLDLFESTNEGYTVTRGIDKDRYQERRGLEGPFQTKSGKVVYYDKKEGKYYDPDTDMYIDHEDYRALDESELAEMFEASYGAPLFDDDGEISSNKRTERILGLLRAKNPTAQNDLEALIMSFDKGQKMDREDINTLYSQNREEEREIDQLEKDLEAIKKRRGMNEDYYETDEQRELARLGRILKDMGAKRDDDVGEAMGFLGTQLTRYGTPQGVNSIEKLEKVTGQPESVIMKMMALAQKVKGDVAVGDETAGNDDEEEVKESAAKKRVIKVTNIKWAAEPGVNLPSSVKITLSADIADAYEDNFFDMINDELEEKYGYSVKDFDHQFEEGYDDYLKRKIGRASDEFDVTPDNWEVKVDGKPWKVFRNKSSANQAASTIQMRYGKKTTVFATRKPVSEGIAEDFDTNFAKRIGATVRGGAGAEYMKKKAKERQAQNKELDPAADRKGLGIGVLDAEKAREKMAKRGVKPPRAGFRTSPRTHDPKRLPEGLDHDIKIGDTVETKKMGQMQGTVTGFSTKYGDTRVMFKHKSGKVYATPASNLKVIDTVKKTESQVAENIDLRHNLQPGTYKHNEENITVTINNDSSVSFKQPAEWEIEGDGEYLEFAEAQLADAGNWTAVVDEAKKKPVPTKPDKWAYAKSQAKEKFDVYPSAYANAWAAKKYKELGGGWRMGKPKK